MIWSQVCRADSHSELPGAGTLFARVEASVRDVAVDEFQESIAVTSCHKQIGRDAVLRGACGVSYVIPEHLP